MTSPKDGRKLKTTSCSASPHLAPYVEKIPPPPPQGFKLNWSPSKRERRRGLQPGARWPPPPAASKPPTRRLRLPSAERLSAAEMY